MATSYQELRLAGQGYTATEEQIRATEEKLSYVRGQQARRAREQNLTYTPTDREVQLQRSLDALRAQRESERAAVGSEYYNVAKSVAPKNYRTDKSSSSYVRGATPQQLQEQRASVRADYIANRPNFSDAQYGAVRVEQPTPRREKIQTGYLPSLQQPSTSFFGESFAASNRTRQRQANLYRAEQESFASYNPVFQATILNPKRTGEGRPNPFTGGGGYTPIPRGTRPAYTSAIGYSTPTGYAEIFTPETPKPDTTPTFAQQRSIDITRAREAYANLNTRDTVLGALPGFAQIQRRAGTPNAGEEFGASVVAPIFSQTGRYLESRAGSRIKNNYAYVDARGNTRRQSQYGQSVTRGVYATGLRLRTDPTGVARSTRDSAAIGLLAGGGAGLGLNYLYGLGGRGTAAAIGIERGIRIGAPTLLGAQALIKPEATLRATPEIIGGSAGFVAGFKMSGAGIGNLKISDVQEARFPPQPGATREGFTFRGTTKNPASYTEYGVARSASLPSEFNLRTTTKLTDSFLFKGKIRTTLAAGGRTITRTKRVTGEYNPQTNTLLFDKPFLRRGFSPFPYSASRTSDQAISREGTFTSQGYASGGTLRFGKRGVVTDTFSTSVFTKNSFGLNTPFRYSPPRNIPQGTKFYSGLVEGRAFTSRGDFPESLDQPGVFSYALRDFRVPRESVRAPTPRNLRGGLTNRRGQTIFSSSDAFQPTSGVQEAFRTENIFDPGNLKTRYDPFDVVGSASRERAIPTARLPSFGSIPVAKPLFTSGARALPGLGFGSGAKGVTAQNSIARTFTGGFAKTTPGVGTTPQTLFDGFATSQTTPEPTPDYFSTMRTRTDTPARTTPGTTPIPFPTPEPPPPTPVGGGFFGLPILFPSTGSGKNTRGGGRGFSYRPDLTSAILDIRGGDPNKILGGFETRGLLAPKRRVKTRRAKKRK